jgi:small-conductance mechanosensitive channel
MERLLGFDWHLFTIGQSDIRVSTLVTVILLIIGLFAVAARLRSWVEKRALSHTHLDPGARQAIGKITQWAILVTGVVLVLQNAGINISAFSVVAGALGIGIGFGLQNLFSNFISGLIIMIERPVKVGDRIEISGVEGDIVEIGARTTTLMAAGRARIIVPNQKFVTDPVRNWEVQGGRSALQVTFKIGSGDPRRTEAVLKDTAGQVEGVLSDPEPVVEMTALDAGGHTERLTVWTAGDATARALVQSRLLFAIHDRLASEELKLA